MNPLVIRDCLERSLANKITFGEVVATLIQEGVEFYQIDLLRNEGRYYDSSGESVVEKGSLGHGNAAADFSAADVQRAVRNIQKGEISYLEFIKKIMAAGTVSYIAYLTGRKVVYLGRKGDSYSESFPQ